MGRDAWFSFLGRWHYVEYLFFVVESLMRCFISFRPANMPWLYYLEDTGDQVLSDTRLSTPYTFPDSRLSFKVKPKFPIDKFYIVLVKNVWLKK